MIVRHFALLLLYLLLVTAVMIGCGGDSEAPLKETAASHLKPILGGIERSSEPRTFVGESLYEHINGGAELYHQYGFVQVSTAYYKKDTVEVTADIYEFADADNAFGLYSALRPDKFRTAALGVEGFAATGSTVYVKGSFVVKVTGFDETPATGRLITKLAAAIAEELTGTTDLPETFGLFPGMFAVSQSERMYAEAYMGRQFLTDVYCQDFVLDNDTLRLLLAEDRSGAKFLQWSTLVEIDSALTGMAKALPFDDGNVFAFTDSFRGSVVAGLKSGYLVGVVNYTDTHEDFLNAWLEELPEP